MSFALSFQIGVGFVLLFQKIIESVFGEQTHYFSEIFWDLHLSDVANHIVQPILGNVSGNFIHQC